MVKSLLSFCLYAIIFLPLCSISSAQKLQPLDISNVPLMQGIEVSKLSGTWYPIAHISNSDAPNEGHLLFEEKGNGFSISSVKDGSEPELIHTASIEDKNNPAIWKTTGKGLFKPSVYFLYVDTVRYGFCMITNGKADKLWILSRKKELDPVKYSQLVRKAQLLQFRVDELVKIHYEKEAPEAASVLDSASH